MAVTVNRLSNGVPVLVDRETNTEMATAGIFFGVGARYEKASENGTAHNLEHMVFKGTKKRSARQIIVEMDDMGADSNAYTGYEGTMYHMTGLASDVLKFVELLSDIAANSTLPKPEQEIERGAIIEEIGRAQDQPGTVMRTNAMMTAFPGQALGATILGPVSNIEKFTQANLKNFRNKHYHAGNMVAAVSGNVDPALVVAAFEKGLGAMPRRPRSTMAPARYVGGASHVERPLNQLQLMVQFKGAAAGDADKWDQQILASVLGGGMSSRLFTEIREKRGLVYGVGAGLGSFQDVGLFTIGAATTKVGQMIPVLCDVLNEVRRNGITEEELARAKRKVKVELTQEAESVEGRMHSMPAQFLKNGSVETTADVLRKVDAVTVESVKAAANKVFSGKMNLSTIGPGQGMESYDKIQARLTL